MSERSLLIWICFSSACASTAPVAPSPVAAPPTALAPPARVAPAASAVPPAARVSTAAPSAVEAPSWSIDAQPLPGASAPVSLDYLFFEPQRARVWVPSGGTGSVAVFDVAASSFSSVLGFKTAEREAHGKKRVLGASSGSIGDGYAYIGNRATSEVCAVELQSMKLGACLKLSEPPDGVEYVASRHELWVTTPESQTIVILDAAKPGSLVKRASIKLKGDPEGYAVDEVRGLFLTNLEDKGSTLTIDLSTHAVKDTWISGCSSDGPRGIAVDSAHGLILVACTDHLQVLDMAHAGALLGKLETGAGLDNIEYQPQTGLVYAAAGKAARLTIAKMGEHGELSLIASVPTKASARNAVVDANGTAYLADGQDAQLLIVRPANRSVALPR